MTGNGGKLYYLFENADDWGMAQMTLFYPHESWIVDLGQQRGPIQNLGEEKTQHSPGSNKNVAYEAMFSCRCSF